MTPKHTEKSDVSEVEHSDSFHMEESKVEVEKVRDGDDALKILHTHYEPYTQDEEKRLLRKIDLRLALLMLVVNGLQFVDKLVCLSSYHR
jgi:hypothetical protein